MLDRAENASCIGVGCILHRGEKRREWKAIVFLLLLHVFLPVHLCLQRLHLLLLL